MRPMSNSLLTATGDLERAGRLLNDNPQNDVYCLLWCSLVSIERSFAAAGDSQGMVCGRFSAHVSVSHNEFLEKLSHGAPMHCHCVNRTQRQPPWARSKSRVTGPDRSQLDPRSAASVIQIARTLEDAPSAAHFRVGRKCSAQVAEQSITNGG